MRCIVIIDCMAARALAGSGSAMSSVRRTGTTCHEKPHGSFSQLQSLSVPPPSRRPYQ